MSDTPVVINITNYYASTATEIDAAQAAVVSLAEQTRVDIDSLQVGDIFLDAGENRCIKVTDTKHIVLQYSHGPIHYELLTAVEGHLGYRNTDEDEVTMVLAGLSA